MNKLAVVLLLCLVPVHLLSAAKSKTPPMAQAVAAIKLKPNWERIELGKQGPDSYELTLHYKPIPKPDAPFTRPAIVEADTAQITRAVLTELLREGKKPSADGIFVFVSAQQGTSQGETGTLLVKFLGHTFYNPRRDLLEFDPYRP
jgi:hypothetical protein